MKLLTRLSCVTARHSGTQLTILDYPTKQTAHYALAFAKRALRPPALYPSAARKSNLFRNIIIRVRWNRVQMIASRRVVTSDILSLHRRFCRWEALHEQWCLGVRKERRIDEMRLEAGIFYRVRGPFGRRRLHEHSVNTFDLDGQGTRCVPREL